MSILGNKEKGVEKEQPISAEVARDQVKSLLDYYGIDVDDAEDKKMEKMVQMSIKRLEKIVRQGLVSIRIEGGEITISQTLNKPFGETKTIEYAEICGEAKVQMEKNAEDNETYKKIYALCASLTNVPVVTLRKFKGVDMAAAESIGMILLQV